MPTETTALTDYERNFGTKKIDMLDLKVCDCATCHKLLVGPSHRQYAHHFGLFVATYLGGRPYCPTCRGPAAAHIVPCADCGFELRLGLMRMQAGKPYCPVCATPAPDPWRHLLKNGPVDRHAITKPEDTALAMETHAQAVAAGDKE